MNAQSRLASAVLERVLQRISVPSASHLMVSFFSLQFQKQCTRRVEGPWRASSQLKKPFKGQRQRPGSCREEQKRIVFPRQGVIDLTSRPFNDFFTYFLHPSPYLGFFDIFHSIGAWRNLIYEWGTMVAIIAWWGEKEEGGWFWADWAGPVGWYQQSSLVHK